MVPAEAVATAVISTAATTSWGKELLISFLASLPGIFLIMYIVVRKFTQWEDRVMTLEDERTKARPYCVGQQVILLEKAKEMANTTVSSALKDLIIQNNQQLSNINTNLALLTQSNETIKEDIREIFTRLNRRHEEPQYTESLQCRRSTDAP